jgi:antitoxin (DNA-binding transcriptional repressor) of toxin-antitoxin stability system
MKTVGVRELKNRLSEYIRHVRSGQAVLVTDRGQIVAELGPPGDAGGDTSLPPGLSALARQGLVTLGVSGDENVYPSLPRTRRSKRSVAQLLDEERGGR